MMAGIDKPENETTPADAPEQRSAALPSRGRQTARGSVPAGFEPFTPIARAEPKAEPKTEPKTEPKAEPKLRADLQADAEPQAEAGAEPATAPPAPPVRPPVATAAQLAAKRESRTGRAYSSGRQAKSARAAVPRTASEPEVALAVPPSRPRVQAKVLMAIAALAVLVVAGAAFALRGGDDDTTSVTETDAGPTASLEFQPPVRLATDTEHIETEVLDDGNLLVTHWIRSSEPLSELSISVPVTPDLDTTSVDVMDLVVAADGVRLDSPDTLVSDATSTALPDASDLYVQYRLVGTVQRNASTPGRALATMTSLDVEIGREVLSLTQVFPGLQVLSAACLAPGPTSLPRPCGVVEEGIWTVSLEAEAQRDTVIVQFDQDDAG